MDFYSFIRKISDVQAYIQNEKSLLDLKSSISSNEELENQKQINKILRKLKKYWLGQFLIKMERKYPNNTSKFRFSDKNYCDFFLTKQICNWKDLKDAQQECLKKLDTNMFEQFCLNLKPSEKNNDFISFITLSIAPSIYDFFISAKNYMYIELIFEITEEKIKKKFVKTLFLIPSFIHFVSTSFHSIIVPFENKEKVDFGNEKSFVETLLQSWINHMNLCPKFIRKYFENTATQDSSIEEMIIFFDHLFKSPDIYQITYFYDKQLPPLFYNENNRIFQYLTENKNIIKNFVLSFFGSFNVKDAFGNNDKGVKYRNDLEQQDVKDEFSDIFLPDTFDSYDIQFLCELINKNYEIPRFMSIKDLFDKEYKLFIFYENTLDNSMNSIVIENSEPKRSDSFKDCFRKLLENSEPLPEFPDSYIKEKDPNFIENYLVYRGNFNDYAKRERLYLSLKSFAVDPLKKLMETDLDDFFNENSTEKDENIYGIAFHKSTILNVEKRILPVQSELLQVLEYNFLIKKFDSISQQRDFRALSENLNTADFIKDPKKLKALFNVYSNAFHNDSSYSSIPEFSINSKKIDFKFTRDSYFMLYQTRSITFHQFLDERKEELHEVDKSFIKMVSSRDIEKNVMFEKLKTFFNSLDCLNKLNFLNKLNIFNKDDPNTLKLKVLNEKFDFYSNNLKVAFSADTNPIQKVIDIARSFADIQNFIVEETNADIERGDIVALRDVIISIVKPKNFVSALVFMFDYYFMICDMKNQLKILFEQMYNIAYRNKGNVINDSLYKHMLICRETLKIGFFGDASKSSLKNKIESNFIVEEKILNSSKNVSFLYLHENVYFVCSIEYFSLNMKLDDKVKIDLNVIAFDLDDQIFKKINDAKKMTKNKFKNSRSFKEFTYVICDQSSHEKIKKEISDKIFDFDENVMSQIINDYQKSILTVK